MFNLSANLSLCVSALCAVPTPPTFFTKVVNSSSVQVLWELPSKAGKAEGFRLSYRRVPSTLFQGPIQLPCHVNAHTITNLGECVCRERKVLPSVVSQTALSLRLHANIASLSVTHCNPRYIPNTDLEHV